MCGKNREGYSDPTASVAIGRVMREEKPKYQKMCESCMHRVFCEVAYKKTAWCSDHKEIGGLWV